jgi:hypothetical protein
MNLMWLAYHYQHVKMIDLTTVCMLFDEPLTHQISDATFKKVVKELD